MAYATRVKLAVGLFLVFGVFVPSGVLVWLSVGWASDDMRVGVGHSGFPPQAPRPSAR